MPTSPSRALLPVALIAGLVAGCAGPASEAGPAPEPAPAPQGTVTSDDIDRVGPGHSIEQMLMDRFPGVDVQRTSTGGVSIRIRGPASFYGNSEPLYVIDGIPMHQGPTGLAGLNPHDIASITILKNPSDTAIYGLHGGNGVIVITTKRPGGRS